MQNCDKCKAQGGMCEECKAKCQQMGMQGAPCEYKFYYFDAQGRGEQIRALFRFYQTKFEDVRVRLDQWPTMKFDPKFEYGQLPVLEVKGHTISQSSAILYFLGMQFKCIPSDPMDEYEMNNVICAVNDIITGMSTIMMGSKTPEERNQKMGEFFAKTFPFYAERIENKLRAKGGDKRYIIGNNVSLADFSLVGLAIAIFSNPDGQMIKKMITEKFPILSEYIDGMLKRV
jgi:glutathione S-transferase